MRKNNFWLKIKLNLKYSKSKYFNFKVVINCKTFKKKIDIKFKKFLNNIIL